MGKRNLKRNYLLLTPVNDSDVAFLERQSDVFKDVDNGPDCLLTSRHVNLGDDRDRPLPVFVNGLGLCDGHGIGDVISGWRYSKNQSVRSRINYFLN